MAGRRRDPATRVGHGAGGVHLAARVGRGALRGRRPRPLVCHHDNPSVALRVLSKPAVFDRYDRFLKNAFIVFGRK